MKTTWNISGMTCGSCVAHIQSVAAATAGISSVSVQLQSPQLTAEAESDFSAKALMTAVGASGRYQATRIDDSENHVTSSDSFNAESYFPLFLIVTFLLGVCALLQWRNTSWSKHDFMADFMGGFFIVFSFFKLLNLRAFAAAFRGYDLLAAAWKPWGLAYPFIELVLGIAYLMRVQPFAVNLITLILMSIGTIGVVHSLRTGQRVQCACLGTVFNLPMSVVTIIEDSGMALMALASLLTEQF